MRPRWQRLPRKTIDGQSFVSYQPFVDYFRGLIRKEKKSRQQTQQVADRRRRKVERNVRKGEPIPARAAAEFEYRGNVVVHTRYHMQ